MFTAGARRIRPALASFRLDTLLTGAITRQLRSDDDGLPRMASAPSDSPVLPSDGLRAPEASPPPSPLALPCALAPLSPAASPSCLFAPPITPGPLASHALPLPPTSSALPPRALALPLSPPAPSCLLPPLSPLTPLSELAPLSSPWPPLAPLAPVRPPPVRLPSGSRPGADSTFSKGDVRRGVRNARANMNRLLRRQAAKRDNPLGHYKAVPRLVKKHVRPAAPIRTKLSTYGQGHTKGAYRGANDTRGCREIFHLPDFFGPRSRFGQGWRLETFSEG